MSMSRTIMQENAPEGQRGRVMGFFSFSFMGAGPIGALLWGFVVEQFGTNVALAAGAISMLAVVVLVGLTSPLWSWRPEPIQPAA